MIGSNAVCEPPETEPAGASTIVVFAGAAVRAVESGLGIASLPDYLARESTKLEMLLPDLNVRTTDVYFTYPEELRHSKRIAVFRDFLLRKVAETRF